MQSFVIWFLIIAFFIHLNASTLILINQDKIEGKILSVGTAEIHIAKGDTLYSVHRAIIDNYNELLNKGIKEKHVNYNKFTEIITLDRQNIKMVKQEVKQIKIDGATLPVEFGDKIQLHLSNGNSVEGKLYKETDQSIIIERYMLEEYTKDHIKQITIVKDKAARASLVGLGVTITSAIFTPIEPHLLIIAGLGLLTTLGAVIYIPFSQENEVLWVRGNTYVKPTQKSNNLSLRAEKYEKILTKKKKQLANETQALQEKIANLDEAKASYKKTLQYILASKQEQLNKVKAALQRIENNTYGICPVTGKKISTARLEETPWILYSKEGEEILKKQEK